MSTNYSLLFYLKKPKNYAGGAKPIYMRITVAGEPKEVSTGRECDPSRWNAKTNRAKGTKEDIRNLNAYLDTLERKVADAYLQLVKDGADITAESLKLKFLGKDMQRRYLMETFTEHNRKMEALLGKGAGTSGIEQPKDEQLPERDCRPVRYHQNADFPYGTAHICHNGDIGQQRAHRNGFQDAGAYQHQDHPALCQAA